MRALIIGAGAIGVVFARHLQLGGAEVSVLVRPKYAAAARAGFVVYPLNRRAAERDRPIRLDDIGVFDDQDAAMQQEWDLVVLALSSTALRSGDWFARLAASLGSAGLLCLTPGQDDPEVVHAHLDPSRVAWAMLSVISYQAPLPGQTLPEPGVAYWFPPLSPIGLSGSTTVVDPALAVLTAGGMPVRRFESVHTEVAYIGSVLDKTILALQCAGWSFSALRSDPELLPLAHRAMREGWALTEETTGTTRPLALRLLRPGALRLALRLAPYVLPLDLERFFAFHYAKVADQTVLEVRSQLAHASSAGAPLPALRELARRLQITDPTG